jgi:hypothetical protein
MKCRAFAISSGKSQIFGQDVLRQFKRTKESQFLVDFMHSGVVGHMGAQQILSSPSSVPQEHPRFGSPKEDEVSQVPGKSMMTSFSLRIQDMFLDKFRQ